MPQGTKIEKIERDDAFWKNNMKAKLTKFYNDCFLIELINPCYPKSLPIRNPDYIIKVDKIRSKQVQNKIAKNTCYTNYI